MTPALYLITGIWRALLLLPDAEIPFNFEVQDNHGQYRLIIYNADDKIIADELTFSNDTLTVRMPYFDSELKVSVSDSVLKGHWINYARKEKPEIPFIARHGEKKRFLPSSPPSVDVNGRWETWFKSSQGDSTLAIGVFKQQGEKVTGTFLESGGDHRFLEGIVSGDSLYLSIFDGFFCRLYAAKISDDKMNGIFWSGNHQRTAWQSKRNNSITLKDPTKSASLEEKIKFAFPDPDSNRVEYPGESGKPVILQILGSWCPNCLDESVFLSEFYNNNKNDIDIIGLAFERTTEFTRASENVKRFVKRLGINYPVLIAGTTGRDEVMKKLPGLKNFSAYPTTIYINRNGDIIKVHSGFSGPATGVEYEKFKEDFYTTVRQLVQ